MKTAFCHTLTNNPCGVNREAEQCLIDGEKDHWDGEDQTRYYPQKVSVRTPDEVERITRFKRDFDIWLIDVRQRKSHFFPDDSK